MIRCIHCGSDFEAAGKMGVLVSPDGDFVCDDTCKAAYDKGREHFFNEVITDKKKFAAWLGVPELYL